MNTERSVSGSVMSERASDGRGGREALFDAALGVALGVLLVLICHGARNQLAFTDPWLYTGLIYGFQDLAEEFGVQYYSLRVGFLLPAIGFHELFGASLGYLLLRVVMLAALVVALAKVARVFVSAGWARCLAALTVLHPWVWRSLFWNYVDGMALVYLSGTFACVLALTGAADWRGRTGWSLGAGGLMALTGGTNFFALGVATMIGIWPLLAFLQRGKWRELLAAGAAVGAGFLVAYGALVAGRYLLVPSQAWQWDLFGLGMGAEMAKGGGAQWHQDPWQLVWKYGWVHLLIPAGVAVGALAAACFSPRENRLSVALAGLVLTATVGLYLVTDFGLKAAVISLFFYFVYLVVPTYVAGCAIVGTILAGERDGVKSSGWIVAMGALGVAAYLGREWLAAWSGGVSPWLLVGIVFGALGAGFGLRRKMSAPALASGLIVMGLSSQVVFYGVSAAYVPMTRKAAEIEAEALRLGFELRKAIGERPFESSRLGFWYPTNPGDVTGLLDAMNGLWYWGFSRVHSWSPEVPEPGMPELTEDEAERLPYFSQLAVLGWDREQVGKGLARLREEGWVAKPTFHDFSGDHLAFVMAIVNSPDFEARVERESNREERAERKRLRAEKQAKKAQRQAEKASK